MHSPADRPSSTTRPDSTDTGVALQDVVLDHVAVAVADVDAATGFWADLGATPVAGIDLPTFRTNQVRLSNGGKVELIGSGTTDGPAFIDGFLDRFGSGVIHHITLKVGPPLQDAVTVLRQAGMDVVDVSTADAYWHESFLRPSQVGGVIVQVAWADGGDEDFARRQGRTLPPVDPSAPALEAVLLGHPDLLVAASVWALLGATVTRGEDVLCARFGDSPIHVEVHQAPQAGPIGLRMNGAVPVVSGPYSPDLLGGGTPAKDPTAEPDR